MFSLRPETGVPSIDDDFIAAWERRYDEKDEDEPKYQRLVEQTAGDLAGEGKVAKETFAAICRWKWGRRATARFRYLELDRYREVYQPRLEEAGRPGFQPRRRLEALTILKGLGTATASTLLHFMVPQNMPIIDTRTCEVLAVARLFRPNRRVAEELARTGRVALGPVSNAHYDPFCEAIALIRKGCQRAWTLRQIDRALFAYHKLNGGTVG